MAPFLCLFLLLLGQKEGQLHQQDELQQAMGGLKGTFYTIQGLSEMVYKCLIRDVQEAPKNTYLGRSTFPVFGPYADG